MSGSEVEPIRKWSPHCMPISTFAKKPPSPPSSEERDPLSMESRRQRDTWKPTNLVEIK